LSKGFQLQRLLFCFVFLLPNKFLSRQIMFRFIPGAALLVPITRSARVQVDQEVISVEDEDVSGGAWVFDEESHEARGVGFACPTFCSECCKDYKSLTGLVSDYLVDRSQFKCTFPEFEKHLLEDADMQGRQCTPAAADPDDAHVWEVLCRFTEEERQAQAWRQLGDCHLDPSVVSFETWLGEDSCSVTSLGRMLARVTGQEMFGFVGLGIRALVSHNPAVVCRAKAIQFYGLGYALDNTTTQDEMQDALCPQLRGDISTGRMDPFTMGLWAAGTGELTHIASFPKPRSAPRLLQKNTIPGWPARYVAYENLDEDPKPINLAGGAVQCMMRRLRREHLADEVVSATPGRNSYGRTPQDPQGFRWPTDIREAYYDNFAIYQPQGNHFDVPADQLLSDATLSKLVFQSIGGHRLEIIPGDGSNAVDLNLLSLGGCAGVPAGRGCPIPLDQALAALPSQTRHEARYAIRMEGLYDDLPVREGMARWGGNAFFNEAGHLLAIQHKGETKLATVDDPAWNYLKYVFRSSLLATVTAVDHLMGCHILMAETLALATLENLEPKDHLRLLLAPHTYGTLQINNVASMNLFAGGMLVHRASPFSLDAYEPEDGSTGGVWAKSRVLRVQKFGDVYNAYRAHRDSTPTAPEVSFFEDGILFFRALEQYVSAYIDEAYGSEPEECNDALSVHENTQRFVRAFFAHSDPATPELWPAEMRQANSNCASLKSLLTECIFAVSGMHRHVGSVSDFYRDLKFASTAWPEGELVPRPKHGFLTLLLAASTNFYGPKMDGGANLTHIFEDKPGAQRVFEGYVRDLADVQSEVEARNTHRVEQGNLAFHQMEPKVVEWGIMI